MARTTLFQASPSNVKTWSSGSIQVGSLTELITDIAFKSLSGGDVVNNDPNISLTLTIQLSRVTPFGRLIPIGSMQLLYSYDTTGKPVLNSGQGGETLGVIDVDSGLGSTVRLDLVYNNNNVLASFDISVVGN